MNYRVIAATALVSFGLGVALTLLVTGDRSSRTEGRRAEGRGGFSAPEQGVERLPAPLREKEAENAALREQVEELRRQLATGQETEETQPAPRSEAPRFVYAVSEEGLRAGNWIELGKATASLMPLMSEAVAVSQGKQTLRPALWGDIMREVGPIVTAAIAMGKAGVRWSHPSVTVNLIHSTLLEAGQPLNERQEQALDQLGRRYVEEDDRRLASYGEGTLALSQRIDDVRLLDRLYADVKGILDEAQRVVLWPPGVAGVAGLDIFAGSMSWDEHWWPLPHADRAGLGAAMSAVLFEHLKLRWELKPQVTEIITAWESGLPEAFVLHEPTPARRLNKDFEVAARILFSADRLAELFGALLAQAPLTSEERERILAFDGALVPILTQ